MKKFPPLFFWVEGGEGRREGRGGGRDAVNVHLSCAISHSNASKLDAVLVDQCFSVWWREERREKREEGEEKRREKKERKKKERESKKEKEEN